MEKLSSIFKDRVWRGSHLSLRKPSTRKTYHEGILKWRVGAAILKESNKLAMTTEEAKEGVEPLGKAIVRTIADL